MVGLILFDVVESLRRLEITELVVHMVKDGGVVVFEGQSY